MYFSMGRQQPQILYLMVPALMLPAVFLEATERFPPTEWTSFPHKKTRPRFKIFGMTLIRERDCRGAAHSIIVLIDFTTMALSRFFREWSG